jgi:hypothetical protein
MQRLIIAMCVATFIGGCASAPTRTPRMTQLDTQQTSAETKVHLYEYLRWFSAQIAAAADDVRVTEKDPVVQEAALRLKANAVSSIQVAVFQRDPLAALADAWALTAAMARFFEDGDGKDLFGGSQSRVVETIHGLEREVEALSQEVVGKERADAVRPEIQRFVRENPIRDLSFGRRSAGLRASAVTAAAWGTSIGSSVAQLDETARDLSDRLTIYAEQLPQIARWQGEILLLQSQRDVLTKPVNDIEDIDRRLGTIDENFGTVTGFVTGTPALIAAERTLMLEAVAHERTTLLTEVDRQRVATLASLAAEREAVLAAIVELRGASFADIGTQTERGLDRMDKLSTATVQDVGRVSRDTIDHLFWRALELLLVGCAAFAVLTLTLRRTTRARER